MTRTAGRCCLWVGLLPLLAPPPLRADDVSPPLSRFDGAGDLLPHGALARLGSLRLRHPNSFPELAAHPLGESLAVDLERSVQLWNLRTGALLWHTDRLPD